MRDTHVKAWDELPEVLEPGVYFVNGEKHTILETIERDLLWLTIRRMERVCRNNCRPV